MSVRDVLEELGVEAAPPGHHHVTEGWVGIDCPHCSPNAGAYRLGIPENTKGSCSCWTCGPHRLGDILAAASGRPLRDVLTILKDTLPDAASARDGPGLEASARKKVAGKLALPIGAGPLLKPHRRYLRTRNIDPDAAARLWGVLGVGIDPEFAWRLLIPVRVGMETVSFTTRSVSDDVEKRYKAARPDQEKVHLREVLPGEELARHAVVINEGPIDAITIGPGAVWTGGTGFSRAQLVLMARYPVRVVAFDNEPDAQKRAGQLLGELELFPGETYNVTFSGKDANSSPKREIEKLRRRFLR